jgi:hypothetical protein
MEILRGYALAMDRGLLLLCAGADFQRTDVAALRYCEPADTSPP